jgi:hypothetical protein
MSTFGNMMTVTNYQYDATSQLKSAAPMSDAP